MNLRIGRRGRRSPTLAFAARIGIVVIARHWVVSQFEMLGWSGESESASVAVQADTCASMRPRSTVEIMPQMAWQE